MKKLKNDLIIKVSKYCDKILKNDNTCTQSILLETYKSSAYKFLVLIEFILKTNLIYKKKQLILLEFN